MTNNRNASLSLARMLSISKPFLLLLLLFTGWNESTEKRLNCTTQWNDTKQFLHILSFDEIPFSINVYVQAHYQLRIRKEKQRKKNRNAIWLFVLVVFSFIRFFFGPNERKRRQSERNRYGILSVCIVGLCRLFGASLWATLQPLGLSAFLFLAHTHLKQTISLGFIVFRWIHFRFFDVVHTA